MTAAVLTTTTSSPVFRTRTPERLSAANTWAKWWRAQYVTRWRCLQRGGSAGLSGARAALRTWPSTGTLEAVVTSFTVEPRAQSWVSALPATSLGGPAAQALISGSQQALPRCSARRLTHTGQCSQAAHETKTPGLAKERERATLASPWKKHALRKRPCQAPWTSGGAQPPARVLLRAHAERLTALTPPLSGPPPTTTARRRTAYLRTPWQSSTPWVMSAGPRCGRELRHARMSLGLAALRASRLTHNP